MIHKVLQIWFDELSEEMAINDAPSVVEQSSANMVTIGVSKTNLKSVREKVLKDIAVLEDQHDHR